MQAIAIATLTPFARAASIACRTGGRIWFDSPAIVPSISNTSSCISPAAIASFLDAEAGSATDAFCMIACRFSQVFHLEGSSRGVFL